MPLGASEERAKGCENEVGAEFAREQRGDRSSTESTQSGQLQHDHLKIPSCRGEDAASRLFPVDFVRLLNGFVRSFVVVKSTTDGLHATLWRFVAQLQAQLPVKTVDALDVDGPAISLQQHMDPAIPVSHSRLADVLIRPLRAAWSPRFDL